MLLCDDKRPRLASTFEVKTFRWNPQKNEQLKADRGVSFEDMVLAIETGGLLDVVPHIEEAESIFLKTIIPSRTAMREYGKRGKP